MAQNPSGFSRTLPRYYTSLWAIIQVRQIMHSTFKAPDIRYRWKKSEDDIWSCALHGRILSLCQDATHLHFKSTATEISQAPLTPSPPTDTSTAKLHTSIDDTEDLVRHYLNLGPNLADMYESWSKADSNFKKKAPKFTGVRILKQDAWEALVGFICSSNNNIIRISQMVSAAYIVKYSN